MLSSPAWLPHPVPWELAASKMGFSNGLLCGWLWLRFPCLPASRLPPTLATGLFALPSPGLHLSHLAPFHGHSKEAVVDIGCRLTQNGNKVVGLTSAHDRPERERIRIRVSTLCCPKSHSLATAAQLMYTEAEIKKTKRCNVNQPPLTTTVRL